MRENGSAGKSNPRRALCRSRRLGHGVTSPFLRGIIIAKRHLGSLPTISWLICFFFLPSFFVCFVCVCFCLALLSASPGSHITTYPFELCAISLLAMRFEDWDVILFPVGRDSKIPFKEFKVACHAAPDLELSHIHGSTGMPVMTCFVPSLPAGTPFQISIHCWRTPDISQFARTYSKHTDLVKFEARILLDGRLLSCVTIPSLY